MTLILIGSALTGMNKCLETFFNFINDLVQVSGMILTAVGGHYKNFTDRVAPTAWAISLTDEEKGRWVDQGWEGRTSGAMTANVPKNWLEQLCHVQKQN